MNQTMEKKLAQFEENRKAINKSGFLIDRRISAACACLFAVDGRQVTKEEMLKAKALLKSKVGFFSNFRGYARTAVMSMLAGKPGAEELLEQSLEAYGCLKKKFFFAEYLPMAAIAAAQSVPAYRYEEIAERTHQIFKRVQKDHPLLTGQEDELMCVLLALQDTPVEQQAENCEFCYSRLKGNFGVLASGDGVQTLSQVIAAAGGNMEENCSRAIELYRFFKERKSAVSNGYALGALGALAILPVPVEQLGEQVLEISEALKKQKGYGFFGIGRYTRMIHAVLLAASEYASDNNGIIAAIQGTISAIIEEEIMIMCMVSAHAAASSASN